LGAAGARAVAVAVAAAVAVVPRRGDALERERGRSHRRAEAAMTGMVVSAWVGCVLALMAGGLAVLVVLAKANGDDDGLRVRR
jgi:hypothetical protein